MAALTQYRCDGCGATKGETNHWWKLGLVAGVRLIVLAWEEHYGGEGDFHLEYHLCGHACVLKKVSEFMGTSK